VVDNTGEEIFADKVGRDAGARHVGDPSERAVRGRREIDRPVRHDPVLQNKGGPGDLLEDRHSYMSGRTNELGALAGFEKSGHFSQQAVRPGL